MALDGWRPTRHLASKASLRLLLFAGLLVAATMLLLGAFTLWVDRVHDWQQAEKASNNLVLALADGIERNIELYDLSLRGTIEVMTLPGIDDVPPDIRHVAMFERAEAAVYLGSELVLDAHGDVIADSTSLQPHKLNLADRDYFIAQQQNPNAGLFLSRPFFSRLRNGEPSISISRRLPGPDGAFRGVAEFALQQGFFQDLIGKFDLGPQGQVHIIHSSGELIARSRYDPHDFGRVMNGSLTVDHFTAESGSYITPNVRDDRSSLFTYRKVGSLPLIVVASVPTSQIYGPWTRKTLVMAPVLVFLCGAMLVLFLLFARELRRRGDAQRELVQLAEKLAESATTDALTNLANRRAFDAELDKEWRRAIRNGGTVALLMIDVDFFKLFNDRFGHPGGDTVLQRVAGVIQHHARRAGDLAARYGGEEFVVIMPDTAIDGAVLIAERIRADVAALGIRNPGGPGDRITVSIGAAAMRPTQGEPDMVLLRLADEAMYGAKRAGRDRVLMAGSVLAD